MVNFAVCIPGAREYVAALALRAFVAVEELFVCGSGAVWARLFNTLVVCCGRSAALPCLFVVLFAVF